MVVWEKAIEHIELVYGNRETDPTEQAQAKILTNHLRRKSWEWYTQTEAAKEKP
jgi:hypothetical protein